MKFLHQIAVAAAFLACVHARGDTFFVTTEDSVVKVTDDSAIVFATGLKQPSGIVEDGAGNVYVGNRGANEIVEYRMVNGVLSGAPAVFASDLHTPQDLAFDRSGNLYEADQDSGTVNEFACTGAGLSHTPVPIITGLEDDDRPAGLGFDSRGNLYVAALIGGIMKFAITNGSLATTPEPFASFCRARQMAFDKDGNLFTADHMTQRVYEFLNTPLGLSNEPKIFASHHGLDAPSGAAFDSAGNLYVVNWGGGNGTDGLEYPRENGVLSNSPMPFVNGFNGPTYILAYKAPR